MRFDALRVIASARRTLINGGETKSDSQKLATGTYRLCTRYTIVQIYFFHLHEEGSIIEDEEGTALVDDMSARDTAVRAARDVLAGAVLEGRLPLSDIVVVTNDEGKTVLRLTLGAAVGHPPL